MASAKYHKGKDGYFTARVWDGTYKDNKKHYKVIRSKISSKDLERKVSDFSRQVEERKNVRKTDILFLDYAQSWQTVYKSDRTHNTNAMYSNIICKHLNSLIGVKLMDVHRSHLQAALNQAAGHGRTQQQIYMTVKQVLESAVSDRLFPANVFADIFDQVSRPEYRSGEKRPLSYDERSAVFKADFSEMDKVFVYIIYGCGLRRGEALALTVFDIDLKNKELTVSKSHEFVDGKPRQKPPKSRNGNRTVPIPDKVFPVVRAWVESIRGYRTYLFTMRNGEPITHSSYVKMWERIQKAISDVTGEPCDLTAHIFRHNYCTQLCYQIPTVSIKRIAQLLGDTESMVLNVYNHIMLEKEDSAGAINAAL